MSGRTFNPNVISEFAKFEDNTLTSEHRAQARKELRETPETRKESLQLLQDMLKGESNLNAITDENFLLRFLRAKKFDVDKAFDQIKAYYAQRQKYPEVFADYLPSTVSVPLDNNLINFLPYRNFDGSAILVVKYGRWDPNAVPFEVFLRVTIMCIEWALENPVTQVCGLTVIEDMEGLNMNHIMHLTPSRIYCYVTSFQDTFPCRYKAVHVVNEPKIFSLAYEIGKPFLTEKLKSRIMFHGNNKKSLYRHVPPDILTEEFGGKLGPFDNSRMCKSILQGEEKFLDNLKFGYSKAPLRIKQTHVS